MLRRLAVVKSRARALGIGAFAAALGACSGTLPGVDRGEPAPRDIYAREYPRNAQPAEVPVAPPPPTANGSSYSFYGSQPPAGQAAPAPAMASAPSMATAPMATAPAMSAAALPASDARDRQLAILTDAVIALRGEVSKSYAHSQELTSETQKLKVLITSLRRELSKSKNENESLKNQLHAMEKRLKEIRTPPPEAPRRQAQPAAPEPPPEPAPPAAEPAPEPNEAEAP